MTTIEDIIKFMKEYELPPSGWKDDELLIPVSTIIPQLVLLQSSEVPTMTEMDIKRESDYSRIICKVDKEKMTRTYVIKNPLGEEIILDTFNILDDNLQSSEVDVEHTTEELFDWYYKTKDYLRDSDDIRKEINNILTKHLSTSKVKEECPKCKYYRENYDNGNYV